MSHDTLNRNTRAQFKQVFDALRELMTPPDPPKRPMGSLRRRTREEESGASEALTLRRSQLRSNVAALGLLNGASLSLQCPLAGI
jgi:hypothetical protein